MNKQSIITILLTILMSMTGAKTFAHDIEVKNADGDEEVNQQDVNDVESFILGETPTVFVRSAADKNGDEKIDVVDIVLMQNNINNE